MKGAVYFIAGGLDQKSGTPSTYLDNKNKNDFWVLYLFKFTKSRVNRGSSNANLPITFLFVDTFLA